MIDRRTNRIGTILFSFLLLVGLTPHKEQPLFRRVVGTGVDFVNQLTENDSMNIMELEYFYRGGGVGIGDFNQDSLPDILLGGNMVSSRLYLNEGNFGFRDVTEAAGLTRSAWVNGISLVDINQDGRLDIYLCVGGSNDPERRRNILYVHQGLDAAGNPTFVDRAAEYGLDSDHSTTQAAFFDYDRDGDLDAFLINTDPDNKNPNVVRIQRHDGSSPNTDQLFENRSGAAVDGPLFIDVSATAGIRYEGFSLGIAVSDINLDGWPDVYVANDHLSNDLLYINNRDGTFSNRIGEALSTQSYYSMGVTIKDLNGDARPDIFTLDMLPETQDRRQRMLMAMSLNKFFLAEEYGFQNQFMKNTLQVHTGIYRSGLPVYTELGQLAGIQHTDWSWGCVAADFDHNGYNDLVIANGYARDITDMDFVAYQESAGYFESERYAEEYRAALLEQSPLLLPNYAFRNDGELQFKDVSHSWGLDERNLSSGIAYADLDRDGDLDLVINHLNQPVSVYENTLNRQDRHYLRIQLVGGLGSPIEGSRVYVYSGDRTYVDERYPVQGFQSCQEPVLHFGLGASPVVDSVVVVWPDGTAERFLPGPVDREYSLYRGRGRNIAYREQQPTKKPAVTLLTDTLPWRHEPFLPFDDFYLDPLLPQSFSQEAPMIAEADIDGNGTIDFFVSSGPDQPGTLFFQNEVGQLERQEFVKGGRFEDMDAEWLDADQDGDLDLYVASGGVRYPAGHAALQDRLYLNTGNGWEWATGALPDMKIFTKSVVRIDFDQDGDDDLFVGSRADFTRYPQAPRSFLLENRGGIFRDVSATLLPRDGDLGMISCAKAADLDGDGRSEIIYAGEWQPVQILRWESGAFWEVTDRYGLQDQRGWWHALHIADVNRDGFPDILAGNLGLNNPYAGYLPLKLYPVDLDGNGKTDPLMSWRVPGSDGVCRDYPVAMRDDITAKIPSVKSRYPTYADFSTVSMDALLGTVAEAVDPLEINSLQSVLLLNQAGKGFERVVLPRTAQFGPITAFLTGDFNRDGQIDILCTGNTQNLPVSMSWNDAFPGALLIGSGQGGTFFTVPNEQIDLLLDRQVRDGAWISDTQLVLTNYRGAPYLLTLLAKDNPEIYE